MNTPSDCTASRRINEPPQPCTQCRLCGSRHLQELMTIGDQYVSDFITLEQINEVKNNRYGHKVPITLLLCAECKLIQQRYTAPQDFMFTRHYWYQSGVTSTMQEALGEIVNHAIAQVKLEPDDIVLDIGSNDGTLLRFYPRCCITVGVEPAHNFKTIGKQGINYLINDFWSYRAYESFLIENKIAIEYFHLKAKPKIITAIGMFYDLENPMEFIADIRRVLHPDGVFIAQLMCAKQMYELGDVGNLAHEHIEFYTLTSLCYLLSRNGLCLYDITENRVNGGSYRLYIKHIEDTKHKINTERINHFWDCEKRLLDRNTWLRWADRVEENRQEVVSFISNERSKGKTFGVIGASTKGNVILQYYGLTGNEIICASERSLSKTGRYTIGSNIPIISEESARELPLDYMIILPYAFSQEVMKREQEFKNRGGRFIIPLPEMSIV